MEDTIERVNSDLLEKGVERPGKLEIGVKCTLRETKWDNYLGFLQGSSGIPLDYLVRSDMSTTWNPATDAANDHDSLKYQALLTGQLYEIDRMNVYIELNAFCLDREGWARIKIFDRQKDGRLATEILRAHYKGVGESNKRITWAIATIKNEHYRSEHTYFFEKFSIGLFKAFMVLNNNSETHSEGQMVRKMLEKVQVLKNGQIEACKRICSSTHGDNFVEAVAYMSSQVTDILPNNQ